MKRNFKKKIYRYAKHLKKHELKALVIKSGFTDLRWSLLFRFFYAHFLMDLKRTKINIICFNTNQIRGLVHFFNAYRMVFRDNALFGRYAGIKKKSW